MTILRNAGFVLLALAAAVAAIFAVLFLIFGYAWIAEKVLPILDVAAIVVTAICLVVLLPLSILKSTRAIAVWGFFIASFLFGLELWLWAFLITYYLWGAGAVFVGLVAFAGVGMVPLALVAATMNGSWPGVGRLILALAATFGARAYTLFLARKIDRAAEKAAAEGSWVDYLRDIEDRRIPQLLEELNSLETGEVRTGKSDSSGSWIETTPENIQRLRRTIAEYRAILVKLRKGADAETLRAPGSVTLRS